MSRRRLNKRYLAVAAWVMMAALVWLGSVILVTAHHYARTTLDAGQQRISAVWAEEKILLQQGLARMARHPAGILRPASPGTALALKRLYRQSFETGFNPKQQLLAVFDGAGNLYQSLTPLPADTLNKSPLLALGAHAPSATLMAINGAFWQLAATPLKHANGSQFVLLLGNRVDVVQLARWQTVTGGTIRLTGPAHLPDQRSILPATTLQWRVNGATDADSPIAQLTLPPIWHGMLVNYKQPFTLAALLGALCMVVAVRRAQSAGPTVPAQPIPTTAPTPAPMPPPETALSRSADPHALRALVLDQLAQAALIVDGAGRIRQVNQATQQLLEQSREHLLRHDLIDCVVAAPQDRERLAAQIAAVPTHGPVAFESVFARGAASIPVQVNAMPLGAALRSPDEPALVLVTLQDISHQLATQAQRVQVEKMAGIGTLAGGIAHDFNNILGGILGYASLLKGISGDDERLLRYSDIIERSAARAAELTQQLSGYAQTGPLHLQRVRFNDVVDEVLALLGNDLEKQGIQVATNLTPLPAVEADPGQLHQVLMNLCANAMDAMPRGGTLTINSAAVEFTLGDPDLPIGLTPGHYVRLTVGDNGYGMDDATLKQLFEPFFTTKPAGLGSGLGLAMSYGMVTNHHGLIDVSSVAGEGTTMAVYLPVVNGVLGPVQDPLPERQSKQSILLVDDDPSLLTPTQEILAGYTVIMARDGEEALALYDQYHDVIRLVILNVVLPHMGAKAVFAQLRERDPALKVIVSSEFSRHGQAQDFLETGANGFAQKPYRQGLLEVVCKVLGTADVADT